MAWCPGPPFQPADRLLPFNNGRILVDVTASANVIVDDLFHLNEPMFQDGVVAQAGDSNVALLVNGQPQALPDDAFTLADLLLIQNKALAALSF